MKTLNLTLRTILLTATLISVFFVAKPDVLQTTEGGIAYDVFIEGSGDYAVATYARVSGTGESFSGIANIETSVTVTYQYYKSDGLGHPITDDNGNVIVYTRFLTAPVTSIRDKAFNSNTGLLSVFIPNSVTSIGEETFTGCTGLASVTIPNSITAIGKSTFSGCTGLASVTIPNSVTTIGNSAFSGCTGLASITIPNSVTTIGNGAFSGCTGLASITIPNSVTDIGLWTFQGCIGLASVTIPNSVTTIGNGAFSGCTGLASITIPNSVTDIGNSAFSGCTGLINAIVDAVNIGNGAFYNCNSLETVTIGNSVTSIGATAFVGCNSLNYVTMGGSVRNIGDRAFNLLRIIKEVRIADLDAWCRISFYNYRSNPLRYASLILNGEKVTDLVIPNTISKINDDAFADLSLNSITIPNSVDSIGRGAFFNCFNDCQYNNEPASVICYATTPPTIKGSDCFGSIDHYSYINLYVPKGTKDVYRQANEWKRFSKIEEIESVIIPGDVNCDGKVAIDDVTALIDILLTGNANDASADVDSDGHINIADVTALTDLLLQGN